MPDAYLDYWRRYVDFTGRSNRSEFWWPVLLNAIVSMIMLILGFIGVAVGMVITADPGTRITNMPFFMLGIGMLLLYLTFQAATFVPTMAISVRRIRDSGNSPWWYLLRIFTLLSSGVYYVWDFVNTDLIQSGPVGNFYTFVGFLGYASWVILFIFFIMPTLHAPEATPTVAGPAVNQPVESVVPGDTPAENGSQIHPSGVEILTAPVPVLNGDAAKTVTPTIAKVPQPVIHGELQPVPVVVEVLEPRPTQTPDTH